MKLQSIMLGAILVRLIASFANGQDATAQASQNNVRIITGCLAKGDSADEFVLTGKIGSTWEVKSDQVALGDHVGHTVKATGVVSHAKMHNMKEDAKDMADGQWHEKRRFGARALEGYRVQNGKRVVPVVASAEITSLNSLWAGSVQGLRRVALPRGSRSEPLSTRVFVYPVSGPRSARHVNKGW